MVGTTLGLIRRRNVKVDLYRRENDEFSAEVHVKWYVQIYLLYMYTHVELCKIGVPSWAYSIMLFICNEELRLGSTSKLS